MLIPSVSDPYSFFTDPDPDLEVEAGDQFGSGYGSGSGSRALMTKNWKKITAEKKNQIFFWSKTAIYLSLGLHKVCPHIVQVTEEACSSQKKPSNTSKHEFFLPLWVIFALLNPDPDPLARLNTDPIRIRIRNPGSRFQIFSLPDPNLFHSGSTHKN
jgi:hypothetical protein